MSTTNVIQALDTALPDAQIIRDCLRILAQAAEEGHVEIELDDNYVRVPASPHMTLVTKAFFKEYYDIGFRTGYRVQVALGGIQDSKHGVLYAKYCFATLYYDAEGDLITEDFHTNMR